MSAVAKTPRASRLKAVTPKAAEPSKPKILIFGKPGVGKTWASLDFPSVYYIDTEGGADLEHYTDKLAKAGGVYFGPEQGSLSYDSVIAEVKALATEQHDFRTVVFDSVSKLFNSAITTEQERLGDKDAFGASKRPAVRDNRRLMDWIAKLDMNVILIAHERELWGDSGRAGVTFDCDAKLEYDLHLVLNIQKQGPSRLARIGKSRLQQFPEGESFRWSYDEFADRYGRDIIEAQAKPIELASEDQVGEVKRLLETVKVPDDFAEKCLTKAGAHDWSEMDAERINKVIVSLKERLAA